MKMAIGMAAIALSTSTFPSLAQAPAPRVEALVDFDHQTGYRSYSKLARANDGNFYGQTNDGGKFRHGTVFRMSPGGKMHVIHNFGPQEGNGGSGLVQGSDGALYGDAVDAQCGYLYRLTLDGQFSVLHTFTEAQGGCHPSASMVSGADGNLYGTTIGGNGEDHVGIAFRMSTHGDFTTLTSFYAAGTVWGPLLQGDDGNFYGTAAYGGGGYQGTLFSLTPQGTLTVLHAFTQIEGAVFYGLTYDASHRYMVGITNSHFFRYGAGGLDILGATPP